MTTAERYAAIPAELKAVNNWVCWRAEPDATAHSGVRKIPVNPRTGGNASTNKPETWADFETAAAAAEQRGLAGIGFVFNGSGFFGIDLDDIGRGLDRAEAAGIVDALQSYTEASFSGAGVHIIARGSLPGADLRRGKVEMYGQNRYFIMTGRRLNEYALRDCTEAVKPLYQRYAARPEQLGTGAAMCAQGSDQGTQRQAGSGLSDAEIVAQARRNSEFAALWAGDLTSAGGDHSSADYSLAGKLMFWTRRDIEQADRLFRQSGLMRPKWDRPTSGSTYGRITLERAALACTAVYGDRRPIDQAAAEHAAGQLAGDQGRTDQPGAAAIRAVTDETAAEYIESGRFAADLADFSRADGLRTGFDGLDRAINGLFPGLYVIGALPGLGKTTLCLQIADQISAAGRDVLFYSLEMSRAELVTKSLARLNAQRDGAPYWAQSVTALDFRRGRAADRLDHVRTEYLRRIAGRLSIIEGRRLTAAEICDHARGYIARTGRRPVVFVDYLQLLAMRGADAKQSAKDYTDAATDALVTLAKESGLTVFAISSLNRSNYNAPISFESFKESGGIEYSADCTIGLQLRVMSQKFQAKNGGQRSANPDEIQRAKAANPRQLELVILKCRTGAAGAHIPLDYCPQCDLLYEPADQTSAAAELAADQSGAGGEGECKTV